jgi:hypothetical protein
MAVVRTLLTFTGGLAAGAVAYATYPKWKHKVAPIVSSVVEGASAAFRDAQAASAATAAGANPEGDAVKNVWDGVSAERNGVGLQS